MSSEDAPCVCGIDPSLTGLAICLLGRDGRFTSRRLTSNAARDVYDRMRRITRLAGQVVELVFQAAPVVVFLEGYAFSRAWQSHQLGELGGALRARLCLLPTRLFEIGPATLKRFATGNGAAKKEAIAGAIERRYGVRFASGDEADAYVLARMAACHVGWCEPRGAHELEALAGIGRAPASSPRRAQRSRPRSAAKRTEARLFR